MLKGGCPDQHIVHKGNVMSDTGSPPAYARVSPQRPVRGSPPAPTAAPPSYDGSNTPGGTAASSFRPVSSARSPLRSRIAGASQGNGYSQTGHVFYTLVFVVFSGKGHIAYGTVPVILHFEQKTSPCMCALCSLPTNRLLHLPPCFLLSSDAYLLAFTIDA